MRAPSFLSWSFRCWPAAAARTPMLLVSLALSASVLGGCKTQYIPNTDIVESAENRRIVEFCEEYRHAVERRNVALLLKMANPAYYEDGGNIDATDDIDYAGLREYLQTKFGDTTAIRYEIRYRDVSAGPGDVIWVDYTYSASYKVPSPQGEVWRRQVADNRLELVPEGDSFTILRGM